jgi:two-component system, OmpR family, sensor histidine kinase KdpD
MSSVEHLPPIETKAKPRWQRYLLETFLAFAGAMLVTGIIYTFDLYPRIPNISIVYLLVVIALASARGRYPAILASVVAFLSFNFFLVPPLYVFTINRIEEWIALFVFLVTAILTSQLAVTLRQRADQASRREREARILYELVRAANSEEELERQLSIIAHGVVDVFSSWGVLDCALLLPDARGKLTVQASTQQPADQLTLSPDERASAAWVMTHGQTVGLHEDTPHAPGRPASSTLRIIVQSTTQGRVARRSLRLIPLKTGQQVVGVLRLRLQGVPQQFATEERLEEEREHPNARTAFFWTFLDQATSVIERARLRRENMRIELLQRTDELRAALLSSVSHDLRTPLSSIKAAASSLLQEDVQWDDEARHSFALAIEHEADRLNRLVGNLLDMSRIEGGALRPEKEWYPLNELIHEVLERLQPLLQGRSVQSHLPDDLPPVELDYLQMDQVLTNLIENAVRYTPPESPIDVSVRSEGEQVIISVADRGPGIPPSDLERVFDKFYRVLPSRRGVRYPTGSGLGLAVSKGLVEAHGGRIWAENREGGGAIFSVALPLGKMEGIPA